MIPSSMFIPPSIKQLLIFKHVIAVRNLWSAILIGVLWFVTIEGELCNPVNQICSGWSSNSDLTATENLSMNENQLETADRILFSAFVSETKLAVSNIKSAGLLAADLLINNLSPGLPNNQWELEVESWFQTSLVKIQKQVIDYASNNDFGNVVSANNTANPPGCRNQRIRSFDKVQNFSFLGIVLIIIISILIILIDKTVPIHVLFGRRGPNGIKNTGRRKRARQMDARQGLLRMALEGAGVTGWKLAPNGIFVTDDDGIFQDQAIEDSFRSYLRLQQQPELGIITRLAALAEEGPRQDTKSSLIEIQRSLTI